MSLSVEQATPLVGSSFHVHTEVGLVELRLASATELPRRGLPERFRTPLSLLFIGPAAAPLGQGTFAFDHPQLGRQQWTLVPVLPDRELTRQAGLADDSMHYEVLFS